MEAIFIRHAQAESNVASPEDGRVGSDLNLTPEGLNQAVATADRLGQLAVDKIISLPNKLYTSPYKRTMQTARIIVETLAQNENLPDEVRNMTIVSEEDLREIQKGDWHGMRVEDVIKLEGEIDEEDKLTFRPPNGENPFDVAERMTRLLQQIEDRGETKALLVSHNHPIESAIGKMTGKEISKWKDRPVDNASISRLVRRDATGEDEAIWEIDENIYNLKGYDSAS